MTKERLIVSLQGDIKKKLATFSKEKGWPMSVIISMAVDEFLEKRIKPVKEIKIKPPKVVKYIPDDRQCKTITCAYVYDTKAHTKCPQCGNSEVRG